LSEVLVAETALMTVVMMFLPPPPPPPLKITQLWLSVGFCVMTPQAFVSVHVRACEPETEHCFHSVHDQLGMQLATVHEANWYDPDSVPLEQMRVCETHCWPYRTDED
jgi:hypothetical protein